MTLRPRDILTVGVILLITYGALAYILPAVLFSAIFSAIQIGFSLVVLLTWVPEAVHAIREQQIKGEHLALLGIVLLAAGAFWSGCFGVIWNALGQPPEMTGTAYSLSLIHI